MQIWFYRSKSKSRCKTQQKLLYKELDKQYRKYSKKYDGYELKQRLTQALARKGYDFSDIASALREYL